MKRLLTILLCLFPLLVQAQVLQPVKWSGEAEIKRHNYYYQLEV